MSKLPQLLDRRTLHAELFGHADAASAQRATVEAIFRACPVVTLPGARKVYVRRLDVTRLLEEHTYDERRVRA